MAKIVKGQGVNALLEPKEKTKLRVSAEHPIVELEVTKITPSKTNPRKSFEKDNIKDLADSMKSVGLLQPITVRPIGDDKWEIVTGERRYRAAKMLKWETIPGVIRNVTDEEMLEVQIIENLQREDVNPIDEAQAFKTLLQKESLDWLSSRIHKPKKYIVDRLKLNDLVPEAVEYVSKGILPLGHAVIISKLEFSDQQLALKECMKEGWQLSSRDMNDDFIFCDISLDRLKDWIADNVMLDFDNAPFDIDDKELYPAVGSCSNCPKRTCNSNVLFQEITSEDRCTDGACFNQKIKLHIERSKQKAKEKSDTVLSGEVAMYGSRDKIKVQGVEVPIQKTPSKNSVAVVITKAGNYGSARKRLGETVYISAAAIENAKESKKENGNQNRNSESWQLSNLKEFWPRLEFIANKLRENQISQSIVDMFFRDKLDKRLHVVVGLFGCMGMIDGVTDAVSAFEKSEELERLDYIDQMKEKKILFDKLLEQKGASAIIQTLMLLERWDEEEDDTYIDHEEEFGYTWNEMQEILEPKPSKKAVAKKK